MFLTPQAESSVAATAATVVVTAAPVESAAADPTAIVSAAVAAGTSNAVESNLLTVLDLEALVLLAVRVVRRNRHRSSPPPH